MDIYLFADKNDQSFRYLAQANNKSEWMWTFYMKYVIVGFMICNINTAMTSMMISWLHNGNIDIDHLYYPYKVM